VFEFSVLCVQLTLAWIIVSGVWDALVSLLRALVLGVSPACVSPLASEASVASHYTGLDRYYREIWGSHVHHGLWFTGKESVEVATRNLISEVARWAELTPEAESTGASKKQQLTVADVGCGYGGTSRVLASEYGVSKVVGFTLSSAQAAYAREQTPGVSNPEYRVQSWLECDLPSASCDAVVAIESLSHMLDKPRAFAHAARVLRPGGRMVLVDWLAAEQPSTVARALLLDPIASEGHLPMLEPLSAYEAHARAAGLKIVHSEDFEQRGLQPWRTWSIVAQRLVKRLLNDAEARRFLMSAENPDRAFVFSLARIPIALRTGSMRLAMLVAEKQ